MNKRVADIQPGSARGRAILASLLLSATILAIYSQTGGFDFVNYDDSDYVSANQIVQRGLTAEGVKYAFTSVVAGNWHPITLLSHMLDCQLWGTKPGAHHLTNAVLHLINTCLVFWLLRALTRAFWPSLLATALFATHPLHVESVAWIAERKDVLSTLFWLGASAAYVAYARKREPDHAISQLQSSIFYSLALFLFALGLMTKPMLVTLPFTLLLLDYWPLERVSFARTSLPQWKKVALEKIPFFIGSLLASIVACVAQRKMGAVVSQFALGTRFENALLSYARYLWKLLWPSKLAIPYPYPSHISGWHVVVVLALLGLVTGLVVWQGSRRRYLAVGWFWYLGTLVPVIGLVQVGMQAMADRYTYVPALGLFIIVGWGAKDFFHWLETAFPKVKAVPALVSCFGAAAVLLCAMLSWRQTREWKNTETLFTHSIQITGDNMFAQYNLGNSYYAHGQFERAVEQYQGALRAQPGYADAENNLGNALGKLGRNEEAAAHYAAALKSGGGAVSWVNRGNSLLQAGKVDEAIAMYQQAATLQPGLMEAHNGLGAAFAQKGQTDEAIQELQKAVDLRPDYVAGRINLASTLVRAGRVPAAIEQYEAALRLEARNYGAQEGLADLLAEAGRIDEAVGHYRIAKEIDPNSYPTRNGLGVSLGSQGKMQEAAVEFEAAIRLNPSNAFARVNLGNTMAASGRIPEAIQCYEAALKLDPNDAQAHHNLGTAMAGQGKLGEAEAHFLAAAKTDPKNHETCYSLGIVLERMGKRPEAILQFQEALRRKPDYAPASNELHRLSN